MDNGNAVATATAEAVEVVDVAALALIPMDKAPVSVLAEEYNLIGKKPSEVRAFFRKGFFPDFAGGKKLTEVVGAICGSYQRSAGVHAIRETIKAVRAGEMLSVSYSKTGLLRTSAHRYQPRVIDPVASAFRRVKSLAEKSEADKERILNLVSSL